MLRMRAGGGGWVGWNGMEWVPRRSCPLPTVCPALPCLLAARQPPARAGGGTPHTFTYYYYIRVL